MPVGVQISVIVFTRSIPLSSLIIQAVSESYATANFLWDSEGTRIISRNDRILQPNLVRYKTIFNRSIRRVIKLFDTVFEMLVVGSDGAIWNFSQSDGHYEGVIYDLGLLAIY